MLSNLDIPNSETEKLAQTLNWVLAPVRFMVRLAQITFMLAMLVALALWNNTAWVIGFGAHGKSDRSDMVDTLNRVIARDAPNVSGTVALWRLDYGHRDAPFRVDTLSDPSFDGHAQRYQVALGGQTSSGGILYSNAPFTGQHLSGYMTETESFCGSAGYDTALGDWSGRSDRAIARKSARMHVAFSTAGIMTGALRYTLSRLKMHLPVQDLRPKLWNVNPGVNSFCNADLEDATRMSPVYYAMVAESTKDVSIPFAPQVMMRLVYVRPEDGLGTDDILGPDIVGMCVVGDCSESDMTPYLTYYGDLFDKVPPLSPGQTRAVHALMETTTKEYWLNTAAANGVHDDVAVLKARREALTTVGLETHHWVD